MKIFYIANARIPTEKAHGIQIMKMCEAFARLGHDVKLIIPSRVSHIEEEAFAYYGMTKTFEIVYLPSLDLIRWSGWIPKIFAYLQNWSFSNSVQKFLDDNQADLLYTRDELTALSLPRNLEIILEVHNVSRILRNNTERLNKLQKIISITAGLKNELMRLGYEANKIQVLPDGVDLKNFPLPQPLPASPAGGPSRKGNSSPLRGEDKGGSGKRTIMYTGNFFAWKGVYVLAEATRLLPEYQFVFVGGSPDEQEKFQDYIKRQSYNDRDIAVKNIKLTGHVPHNQIPEYLSHADVLVLPNSGKTPISRYYTSPMKMFEYMAVGKPIVASDMPSIREILNESNSILVKPDDPQALAQGIKKAIEDSELAKRIAAQASTDAKKYTWQNRAKAVIDLMS